MKFDFDEIRDILKRGGIIETEEEFSFLMGKSPSYVSSAKSKGVQPSFDSLCHLAFNLENDLLDYEADIRSGNIDENILMVSSTLYQMQNEVFDQIRQMVQSHRNQAKPAMVKPQKTIT